ncbi:11318_t:CDS:1, partial [Diversispora eburnea]
MDGGRTGSAKRRPPLVIWTVTSSSYRLPDGLTYGDQTGGSVRERTLRAIWAVNFSCTK